MEYFSLSVNDKNFKSAIRFSLVEPIDDLLLISGKAKKQVPEFKKIQGNKIFDILPTGYSNILLINPKCINFLEDNAFTGWGICPINVNIPEIKDYKMLMVPPEVGPINHALSKKVELPPLMPNAPKRITYKGMLFDENTWTGDDFFRSFGTTYIYVTKRVKDAFEESQITNVQFTNIEDLENIDKMMGFV